MSGAVYRIPHSLLLPLRDADVCAFCHMFFKKKTIHCGRHVVQSCSQFFPLPCLAVGGRSILSWRCSRAASHQVLPASQDTSPSNVHVVSPSRPPTSLIRTDGCSTMSPKTTTCGTPRACSNDTHLAIHTDDDRHSTPCTSSIHTCISWQTVSHPIHHRQTT